MTKISELPNTHNYPLRALAELRYSQGTIAAQPDDTVRKISWLNSPEHWAFWVAVDEGQHPPIPAESIEDLRRAGMMPEPEKVIQGFERVDNPKEALYVLLHDLRKKEQGEDYGYILTHKTPEGRDWWQEVFDGKEPLIPAASIEDLRKAGMMPEPEYKITRGFIDTETGQIIYTERIDTAPPPFMCGNSGKLCDVQCRECRRWQSEIEEPLRRIDEDKEAARGHNDALTNGTFVPPSITLEDYARMEREEEAISSPAHYKVCEGLEVVDMIRAVLTPEQFRGYCLGNLIKYRMRAGKKTMSPMEDLGKAHVYETWLAEMEGGEG